MPRGKAAAGKKPKAAASKTYQMADRIPEGEVLRDLRKGDWKIGKPIGSGGFGLLYLGDINNGKAVGPDAKYVIKIEPHENGPLFVELSYYLRCALEDDIKSWMSSKKLRFLGVPKFVASGSYTSNKQKCRFMVMQRFGKDLQKLFEEGGKKFPLKTVCTLAVKLIDCLEYIHSQGYAHADIKASNLLLGHGKGKENEVYLVDYGLAQRFRSRDEKNEHNKYVEDPRKKHDGTIEFTSRDAHKGVGTSRRGDLEILGYCLLQWLCGRLPWEDNLPNPDYVMDQKNKFMKDIPKLLSKCFSSDTFPDVIKKYLQYVVKLDYEEEPNYAMLRQMFRDALKANKLKDDGVLVFTVSSSPVKKAAKKRRSEETLESEDEENNTPPKRRKAARAYCSPAKRATPSTAAARSSPAARTPASKDKSTSWKNSPAFANSMQPPLSRSPKKAAGSPKKSAMAASQARRLKIKKLKADAGTQTSPGLKGLKRSRRK